MLTVDYCIGIDHQVTATCRRCSSTRMLDVLLLAVAGRGQTEIGALPLRCTGIIAEADGPGMHSCDGKQFSFQVTPRDTGPRS